MFSSLILMQHLPPTIFSYQFFKMNIQVQYKIQPCFFVFYNPVSLLIYNNSIWSLHYDYCLSH